MYWWPLRVRVQKLHKVSFIPQLKKQVQVIRYFECERTQYSFYVCVCVCLFACLYVCVFDCLGYNVWICYG
jgi:hypothetical protein